MNQIEQPRTHLQLIWPSQKNAPEITLRMAEILWGERKRMDYKISFSGYNLELEAAERLSQVLSQAVHAAKESKGMRLAFTAQGTSEEGTLDLMLDLSPVPDRGFGQTDFASSFRIPPNPVLVSFNDI